MTELELQEKVLNLRNELNTILTNGEAEVRELTEDENNRVAEIRQEIDNANAELKSIEDENKRLAEEKNNNTENTQIKMKEVRLFDLIKGTVNGTLSDEQREFVHGNKIDYRAAIMATQAGQGQENVPEDKKGLDVAIRNASVLNKIGATWFGNAVGDISIPKYAGSNVAWKGEGVAADDGASGFTETILSPKRLTAYIDISKQFLAQDSNDAEGILINDLAAAIAEKLDKTVFGDGVGSSTVPAGLFNSGATYLTTGTSLTAATYDSVLDLESAVEEKNGQNFMFIANPKVKYQLKGTQMASGLQMVYNAGEIDGYKAVVSNSVANKGIICMDPKDLAVATWGGVEITVDTVSRAIYNEVRVVVNYLVDAKLRGDRISAELFS
jgi:HK97 family phage major capsid protein